MSEFTILLFLFLAPIVVIVLPILGAIVGFAFMKTAQKSAPYITNSDVATVTRAWAVSFGLGGLIASMFLGVVVDYMGADFISLASYYTIVFAIIGTSAGLIGVRSMFKRLVK